MKRWLSLAGAALAMASAPMVGAQEQDQDVQPGVGPLACVMEPRSVVKLGSSEEGILREILVDRGDRVAAGQVVARLDSELEKINVELARVRAENDVELESSRARLVFRESEVARMEQLHTKSIVATKSLDEAAVEQRLAEHAVRSAKLEQQTARLEHRMAKARFDRRSIRSPVEGVVVERNMTPGEYAHEQAPVMTIAEIDPLNVEVFVPIDLYGSVALGMPAEVEPAVPIGGSHRARVTVVDPVFDTASGTFGVRLALPNPEGRLPAGLKCRVRFLPMEASGDAGLPEAEGAGAPEEARPEPVRKAAAPASRSLVFELQRLLSRAGYDVGAPDGRFGPRTQKAIEAFQRAAGLAVDGRPSAALKAKLEAEAAPEPRAEAVPLARPKPKAAAPAPSEDRAAVAAPGAGATWYESFRSASKAMQQDDLERAQVLYGKVLESRVLPIDYRVLALTQRAAIHARKGRDAAARADLDQALEVQPDNGLALAQRGRLHLDGARFDLARRDYDRALAADPTMVEAYYGRALAHDRLGDHRRAIEDYDRISSLDPEFSAAYFNRALAYERLGEPERAAREYALLYRLEPDFPGLKARMQQLGLLQP